MKDRCQSLICSWPWDFGRPRVWRGGRLSGIDVVVACLLFANPSMNVVRYWCQSWDYTQRKCETYASGGDDRLGIHLSCCTCCSQFFQAVPVHWYRTVSVPPPSGCELRLCSQLLLRYGGCVLEGGLLSDCRARSFRWGHFERCVGGKGQ
jgi:hypothetical protein